jgi:hypothetical protein
MKKAISVLALLVGLLVIPAITLGACGGRPDCGDCLSQETCEAELLCYWDTDTCYNQSVYPVEEAGINSLLANVGGLFSDASLFIWVVIGLPLGFYVIKRVVALVPKK